MENLNFNENLPVSASRNYLSVEQKRSMAEIQAKVFSAKTCPRDRNAAYSRIMQSCERKLLAEKAIYAYPRGKDDSGKQNVVSGPSIRLAEAIAQNWGNISFGMREVDQEQGQSVMQAFCIDWETNTTQTRDFIVPHFRKAGGKIKSIDDPRDIYEYTANMGARRMRACILSIIPIDIVEEAIQKCKETQAKALAEAPLSDRIRNMVLKFSKIGVTQEMIERYLEHKVDACDVSELVDLGNVFKSISDGQATRADFFEVKYEEEAKKFSDQKTETTNNEALETARKAYLASEAIMKSTFIGVDTASIVKVDMNDVDSIYRAIEVFQDYLHGTTPQEPEKPRRGRKPKQEKEEIKNEQKAEEKINQENSSGNTSENAEVQNTAMDSAGDRQPEWYLGHPGAKAYATIEKAITNGMLKDHPIIINKLTILAQKELNDMDHIAIAQSLREAMNGNHKNLDDILKSRASRGK